MGFLSSIGLKTFGVGVLVNVVLIVQLRLRVATQLLVRDAEVLTQLVQLFFVDLNWRDEIVHLHVTIMS